MKKKLIALITILAVTAFSGCQSKGDETAENTTASVSETTTVAETTTAAEETTETTTTEEITETEAVTEPAEDINLFKGTGYTLSINGNKWLDYTEYLELIANYAEDTELAQKIDVTADDMKNMGDAIFYHSSNGSNFNVVVSELGQNMDDETITQLASIIQEQYNSVPGYSCNGYEMLYINGYRALKVEITADDTISGFEMKLVAYLFYPGTKQVGVTFSADASNYDDAVADFEEVLNTIAFE